MSETSGGNPNSPWVPDSTGNGSREDAMPTEVYGHPMSVFLMPRYRSLCLLDTKGEAERREAIQQLRAQRAVERFLNDGCLVRAATMGVGGGLLGILFGAFFFTMKPVDVDTTLGFRAQLREQYKSFVPEVASTAKNFAKIGALFSFCECIIDKGRATHDLRGAVYGGCLTGALLAIKGGPRAMIGGSLGFGAFAVIMELLQPFAGFDS
ncbi:mitochondrial import inner membrane translocase subunit TIM22-4 [Cyclospora cayetanensis]|uniref:Mitochondrial import inner membrane translocase subunit TIM22 n=1 Tax=Cyclospora cayetanensis TaxID=88456 RepID=A0A6P6RV57_9EIME|nr:mitochondrial import inner membrane translocase subunit TIM22-4 [Cyclospora cayetanensis]